MATLKEFSDKVREAGNIVDIIGSYIELRKSGSSFKALCPFHKEKTPSFFVSPTKQIFHCFGCNVGGDVITFVKDYEKVDFKEAVLILARKLNIAVPSFRPYSEDASRDAYRNTLFEVHKLALEYFREQLLESRVSIPARKYIKERGMTRETVEHFQMGFAPSQRDALLQHLRSKGYSVKTLEDAGLISALESGGYSDRFRARLIFPIFDNIGRCVGFGGRRLDDGETKYLNSPETILYKKGRLLYGLNLAKEAFRDKPFAILLEGYTDVIAAHQFGFDNAVATLGTALTDEQARLLRKFVREVYFLYDGDEAGQSAMMRGCEVLLGHDLRARIALLPPGEDPDSFLRKSGSKELGKLLSEAVDFFDFFLSVARAKWDLSAVDGKVNTINLMKPMLRGIKDRIHYLDYQHRLAEALQLQEGLVSDYLKDAGEFDSKVLRKEVEDKRLDRVHLAEKGLLKILIDNPSARKYLSQNFDIEWIFDKKIRKICEKVISIDIERLSSFAALLEICEDEQESALLRSIALWEEEICDTQCVIQELLGRLRMRYYKLNTLLLMRQIQAFEKRDGICNLDDACRLTPEIHERSAEASKTHKLIFGQRQQPDTKRY